MSNITQQKISSKANNKKIGDLGEGIASMFLEKHGFTIIDRNYRKKYGEIDIVAEKKGIIHFVEVKSVSCRTFPKVDLFKNHVNHETGLYKPEDNVHQKKLKRLERVIQAYILEHNAVEREWVFDVITVHLNKELRLSRVFFIGNLVL